MDRLVILDRPSPNHGPRLVGPIDTLAIHYTGMPTLAAALDRLCDSAAAVSAHYLIAEDGTCWRLVDERLRAWHAGRSFWAGETDINSRSIGIELANPGHGPGYCGFPEMQMRALETLAKGILARHPITPSRVLAHSDLAPDRKVDPGELFDWRRLAASGIGLWSDASGESDELIPHEQVDDLMRRFGYRDASPSAIAAFQRHFRPGRISGRPDGETAARLADLVERAGKA